MFRRQFVQFLAVFGTGSMATIAATDAGTKSMTYVLGWQRRIEIDV